MLNVLSLDGGPGPLLQIELLRHIVAQHPGFLRQIDLFAGTSNGALMSLYLARELSDPNKREESIVEGCIDFSNRYCKAVDAGPGGFVRFLLGQPLGKVASWKGAIEKEFGAATLGQLGKRVAIMTFDTEDWGPRVLRNFGKDLARDGNILLADAALASSAFPPLLPIFGGPRNEEEQHGYLDGFLSCNNPAMSALTLAARDLLPPGADLRTALTVLSLGCCQTHEEANLERRGGILPTLTMLFSHVREQRFFFFEDTVRDRVRYVRSEEVRNEVYETKKVKGIGQASWGWPALLRRPTFLADLLLHGTTREIHRQCRRLLGDARYHRCELATNQMRNVFQMTLVPGGEDGTRKILDWEVKRALKQDGTSYPRSYDENLNSKRVKRLQNWINRHWFKDEQPRPDVGIPYDEALQ